MAEGRGQGTPCLARKARRARSAAGLEVSWLPLPVEPSTPAQLLPPLGHPTPESGPPLFTVTIYSSFLLFVRNSHRNQCKTIHVGVLFYITKLLLI